MGAEGRSKMTTLESRLEDYRQQIERLENERTKLWNTIMGKNRQIDELLERLEPGPESEPEERVRISFTRKEAERYMASTGYSGYDIRPVEKPPVEPKRMRVVVELAKGGLLRKPEGGESVTLYANQDCWVGTVVEIEEGE